MTDTWALLTIAGLVYEQELKTAALLPAPCCAVTGSKWCHQCRTVVLISRLFWLEFCRMGRNGDMSSIFIYLDQFSLFVWIPAVWPEHFGYEMGHLECWHWKSGPSSDFKCNPDKLREVPELPAPALLCSWTSCAVSGTWCTRPGSGLPLVVSRIRKPQTCAFTLPSCFAVEQPCRVWFFDVESFKLLNKTPNSFLTLLRLIRDGCESRWENKD